MIKCLLGLQLHSGGLPFWLSQRNEHSPYMKPGCTPKNKMTPPWFDEERRYSTGSTLTQIEVTMLEGAGCLWQSMKAFVSSLRAILVATY